MRKIRKLWQNRIVGSAIVCLTLLGGAGCSAAPEKAEATRDFFAMDTFMTLQVYGDRPQNAIDAAVEEIERLDGLLSTEDENSEVGRLNAEGGGSVGEDTLYLLQRSIALTEDTKGAFDITIYPVMKAWGFAGGTYRVPEQTELQELLRHVNAAALVVEEKEYNLQLPEHVQIDFGSIAKGYASQRAVEVLRREGIESAMLNLGGNVALLGTKPDGTGWRIAIQDPKKNGNYLGVVEAKDCFIITSGGYERYFEEDGVIYHHIMDPATGMPARNGLLSVTILSADGTLADGLSTALFVMGPEKATDYWKEHHDLFDMILYTEDGTMYITEGIRESFSSQRPFEVIDYE